MSMYNQLYLVGARGDLRQAVIDAIGRWQDNFEVFADNQDEEHPMDRTPEGVADYIVQHAKLFSDDPLDDYDVVGELNTNTLEEESLACGEIDDETEKLLKLVEEYKESLCAIARDLRNHGFTLYKVVIDANLDIQEIFKDDTADSWEGKDAEFYFEPLFWDSLEAHFRGGELSLF